MLEVCAGAVTLDRTTPPRWKGEGYGILYYYYYEEDRENRIYFISTLHSQKLIVENKY